MCRDEVGTVRKYFARRPLRRRIVALAAAYAIALSSLIASFGAASAAAAAAAPNGIICHTLVAGDEAPSSGDTNAKHCIDNCCIGCLMLMAAVPPPPAKITVAPLSASQAVASPQNTILFGGLQTKDHRSRAPPLAA
jgi:hypothetical protein